MNFQQLSNYQIRVEKVEYDFSEMEMYCQCQVKGTAVSGLQVVSFADMAKYKGITVPEFYKLQRYCSDAAMRIDLANHINLKQGRILNFATEVISGVKALQRNEGYDHTDYVQDLRA